MKSRLTIIFGSLLILSLCTNVFLFISKNKWHEAWVNQFITTSDIENILKTTNEDMSFAKFQEIALKNPNLYMKVIDISEPYLSDGIDKQGIKISETILLFENGIYVGSKANLPNH